MRTLTPLLERLAPYTLSLVRIVSGLLFLQHGLVKLFAFPIPFSAPLTAFSLLWFAGIIECIGGLLLILGLGTRWAAFLCSGEMAIAYFNFHQPRGLTPIENGGDLAILFCFVFLFLFFAGPGPLSIDKRACGHV
jgi:putative oxidoreductase